MNFTLCPTFCRKKGLKDKEFYKSPSINFIEFHLSVDEEATRATPTGTEKIPRLPTSARNQRQRRRSKRLSNQQSRLNGYNTGNILRAVQDNCTARQIGAQSTSLGLDETYLEPLVPSTSTSSSQDRHSSSSDGFPNRPLPPVPTENSTEYISVYEQKEEEGLYEKIPHSYFADATQSSDCRELSTAKSGPIIKADDHKQVNKDENKTDIKASHVASLTPSINIPSSSKVMTSDVQPCRSSANKEDGEETKPLSRASSAVTGSTFKWKRLPKFITFNPFKFNYGKEKAKESAVSIEVLEKNEKQDEQCSIQDRRKRLNALFQRFGQFHSLEELEDQNHDGKVRKSKQYSGRSLTKSRSLCVLRLSDKDSDEDALFEVDEDFQESLKERAAVQTKMIEQIKKNDHRVTVATQTSHLHIEPAKEQLDLNYQLEQSLMAHTNMEEMYRDSKKTVSNGMNGIFDFIDLLIFKSIKLSNSCHVSDVAKSLISDISHTKEKLLLLRNQYNAILDSVEMAERNIESSRFVAEQTFMYEWLTSNHKAANDETASPAENHKGSEVSDIHEERTKEETSVKTLSTEESTLQYNDQNAPNLEIENHFYKIYDVEKTYTPAIESNGFHSSCKLDKLKQEMRLVSRNLKTLEEEWQQRMMCQVRRRSILDQRKPLSSLCTESTSGSELQELNTDRIKRGAFCTSTPVKDDKIRGYFSFKDNSTKYDLLQYEDKDLCSIDRNSKSAPSLTSTDSVGTVNDLSSSYFAIPGVNPILRRGREMSRLKSTKAFNNRRRLSDSVTVCAGGQNIEYSKTFEYKVRENKIGKAHRVLDQISLAESSFGRRDFCYDVEGDILTTTSSDSTTTTDIPGRSGVRQPDEYICYNQGNKRCLNLNLNLNLRRRNSQKVLQQSPACSTGQNSSDCELQKYIDLKHHFESSVCSVDSAIVTPTASKDVSIGTDRGDMSDITTLSENTNS